MVKVARRKRAPSRPPAGAARASSRPFLRFHHSPALRKKTLSILAALEGAEDPTTRRDDLADLVVELTACGMDSYFLAPLKSAKAGFLVEQSASLGMAGAKRVLGSVIRNIIGRMEGPQLLSVCASVRQFMV